MKILIIRIAAVGDCVQITPLVRFLKEQGHEVVLLTSENGEAVFKFNPFLDKLILHKANSVPNCDLLEYFNRVKAENNCDKMINLCESVEVKYLFHPVDPVYNYSKDERFARGNKNHYDIMFEGAGYPEVKGKTGEMYFSEQEETEFARWRSQYIGKFLVLWCLSGSSIHKSYPYTRLVMERLIMKYKDIVFITVGDDWCRILEAELEHERCIHKSGEWSLRQTALACKHASLVVSPETGVLHFAGCFDTPKIGMLTHTTKECLSKYFKNDYSMQADVDCSPCFRIIETAKVQCPIDKVNGVPWCASFGFHPDKVIKKIEEVYHN
jgi:ADP-heptose:LPS heptosyltransferase